MSRLRSYLALLRGSFMVGMIYRYGFLFTILGNVIYLGVTYFLWRSIYHNADLIHGLTFDQTYLYVALGSAVFILLKTYADWLISNEIREGMIAVYLTKPLDYQLYALFISLGSALMNLAAITVPTILLLTLVFKVHFQSGPGLAFFPFSLLLAFMISFNFDYLVGLMAFYNESVWGLTITKEVLLTTLSGALIPLQFFPQALQKVLLVLPFQAIYYTPLTMVTQPDQHWPVFLQMLAVQFSWVVVMFILTRLVYDQAVKVLRVSGG
jgi:viologen exporter family transport system permease protein